MSSGSGGWTLSAKIFIAIGAVLGAIAIIAPILFLTKWRKQNKKAQQEEAAMSSVQQTEMEEMRSQMRSKSRQSMRLDGHQVPYRSPSPAVGYHFPSIPSRASSRMSTRQSSATLDVHYTSMASHAAGQDSYQPRDSWRTNPELHRSKASHRASYHPRTTNDIDIANTDIHSHRNARWSAPEFNALTRHDTVRSKHRAYPSVIHETPTAHQSGESNVSKKSEISKGNNNSDQPDRLPT